MANPNNLEHHGVEWISGGTASKPVAMKSSVSIALFARGEGAGPFRQWFEVRNEKKIDELCGEGSQMAKYLHAIFSQCFCPVWCYKTRAASLDAKDSQEEIDKNRSLISDMKEVRDEKLEELRQRDQQVVDEFQAAFNAREEERKREENEIKVKRKEDEDKIIQLEQGNDEGLEAFRLEVAEREKERTHREGEIRLRREKDQSDLDSVKGFSEEFNSLKEENGRKDQEDLKKEQALKKREADLKRLQEITERDERIRSSWNLQKYSYNAHPDDPVSADFRALSSLGADIKTVIAPDVSSDPVLAMEMIRYALLKDAAPLIDCFESSLQDSTTFSQKFSREGVYIAYSRADLGKGMVGMSAVYAGVISRYSDEAGWLTPSNQKAYGITGVEHVVGWGLKDKLCEAVDLNKVNISPLVKTTDGWRVFGNRDASGDFMHKFLTEAIIKKSIESSILWAVDQRINMATTDAVQNRVNSFLSILIREGAVYGGECVIDEEENPESEMEQGRITYSVLTKFPYIQEHIKIKRGVMDVKPDIFG